MEKEQPRMQPHNVVASTQVQGKAYRAKRDPLKKKRPPCHWHTFNDVFTVVNSYMQGSSVYDELQFWVTKHPDHQLPNINSTEFQIRGTENDTYDLHKLITELEQQGYVSSNRSGIDVSFSNEHKKDGSRPSFGEFKDAVLHNRCGICVAACIEGPLAVLPRFWNSSELNTHMNLYLREDKHNVERAHGAAHCFQLCGREFTTPVVIPPSNPLDRPELPHTCDGDPNPDNCAECDRIAYICEYI